MTTDKMTVDERFKYLRMMQERYHKAGRRDKSRLLDEAQASHCLYGQP